MAFINKQAIHAELLEGDDIILAAVIGEFLKTGFKVLFSFFHLLYGKTLAVVRFKLRYALGDFPYLFL